MKIPSTVDPAEQQHFEKLSKLWWDADGPFWPLHGMNALRTNYIRDQLALHMNMASNSDKPLAGLRILDIGCGGGILSESIARLGARVHGVDMVEKNIRIAGSHAEGQGLLLEYECGTAEQLAGRGEQYDALLNMEVVEHVADLPLFIQSCAKLVRPGGVMLLATINRTVASFLGAIIAAEYILRWLPKGTHHWQKFPKPSELESLLLRNGMTVVNRTGMTLNPLTHQFRLIPFEGVNYILVATKPLCPAEKGSSD